MRTRSLLINFNENRSFDCATINSAMIGRLARAFLLASEQVALRLTQRRAQKKIFIKIIRSKFVSCSVLMQIWLVVFMHPQSHFGRRINSNYRAAAFSIPIKSRTTPEPDTKETECGLHRGRCQSRIKCQNLFSS